jgi:hypothetical protein
MQLSQEEHVYAQFSYVPQISFAAYRRRSLLRERISDSTNVLDACCLIAL